MMRFQNQKVIVPLLAEVGMVVACDFKEGNQPPAKDNLAFIEQCQSALPDDCFVRNLRIDAAGYQVKIIQYCVKKIATTMPLEPK